MHRLQLEGDTVHLSSERWFQVGVMTAMLLSALVLGYSLASLGNQQLDSNVAAGQPLPNNDIAAAPTRTPPPTATTRSVATTSAATTTNPASPIPQAEETPGPIQADVLISDAFDTATNGWPTAATDTWSAGYVDGRYQLALNGRTSINFTTALPAENYRLGVDVTVNQGGAGLIFLFGEPAVTYRIIFSNDGAYAIERVEGETIVKVVDWTANPNLVSTPGSSNRLEVERRGPIVNFFANGQLLTDFTIPEGEFVNRYGFVLTARSGQGQATFDNLLAERLPRPS